MRLARGKFPGWRTMTSAERYNARMHAMFEHARQLDLDWLRSQRAEIVDCVDGGVMILIDGVQWGGNRDLSGAGDATFPCFISAMRALRTSNGPVPSAVAQAERESAPGYDPTCVFCKSGEEPGHEH